MLSDPAVKVAPNDSVSTDTSNAPFAIMAGDTGIFTLYVHSNA
jgi:hypothetical protein